MKKRAMKSKVIKNNPKNPRTLMTASILVAIIVICIAFIYILTQYYPDFGQQTRQDKLYILKSQAECATIKYVCKIGFVPFQDEVGCGCEKAQDTEERTLCDPGSRNAQFCTADYNPVCGWFNDNLKCIKYPCAQTYSNSCEACKNTEVSYYTKGECPE